MMQNLIDRYPTLAACENEIKNAINVIIKCYENGGKLLLAGNGGSSADCDHIVGELMKGFMKKRALTDVQKSQMKEKCQNMSEETLSKLQNALPAISLSSFSALNTAFSNDVDADLVFAQGVFGLGRVNDVLIAISTSGNSHNVVEAVKVAKAIGMKVIAFTGKSGGALRNLADITVGVPESETYKVQELHLPVYHHICASVENYFFG
jgi:D-sedoheptulose 7-phosphate isomerase